MDGRGASGDPKWAFYKADWDGFREGCETAIEDAPPAADASTEQLLALLSRTILSQSVAAVPRGARADPKPWALDPDLAAAMAERREARDAMRADRSRAAKERWLAAKRKAAVVEQEAKTRSFRDFASNKLNKPANIGMVTKVLRKMEGSVQACPGHAIQGDHGLAVGDLEKATSFARTYAQVSRQVRASKQDRAVKSASWQRSDASHAQAVQGQEEAAAGRSPRPSWTRSYGSCETRKPQDLTTSARST